MPMIISNPTSKILEHKKVILADVDETICESCQIISNEMTERISNLIDQGYEFTFISGSGIKSLSKMISSKLNKEHRILATSGTNYTKFNSNGTSTNIYNKLLTIEEKKEISGAFDKLIEHFEIKSMTTKEDQVQDRDSQITLSAIGRHAPTELKAAYDPDGEIRQIWIEFLKKDLGEIYDIKIGGTTSVDITKKGLDKEWGIKEFLKHQNINPETVIFFGDKLYPGGNDAPASNVVDCISVKNPKDTLERLKELFP
jgi:phosphomannomutase